MSISSPPKLLQLPFALNTALRNNIPVTSASPLASYNDGFPVVTMLPITAGGIPPEGQDFNGILYDITTHTVWVNAGGQYTFDAAFATAVGGYPVGIVLQSNDGLASYVNVLAGNSTDFNSSPSSIGVSWLAWAGAALRTQGIIWCGTSGGSANVQTFTPSPPITAVTVALTLSGIAGFTNTSALTLNVSGLGAINVFKESPTGPIALTGGEWVAGNIVTLKYDGAQYQLIATELGNLATLNIGQGLENDGAGNLRVKLADSSIRRSSSGIQVSEPIVSFSGAVSITSASNNETYVSSGAGTLTVPATSTLWNGFAFTANALVGNITVTPNAADSINGAAAGTSYIVPATTSAVFISNGAGAIYVSYQTSIPGFSPAPQYISTTQSISAGQYDVGTIGGAVSLTLPASPTQGTIVILTDAQTTWEVNPVTLIAGGGNTIDGSAANCLLNVNGFTVTLIYLSTNWSFQ